MNVQTEANDNVHYISSNNFKDIQSLKVLPINGLEPNGNNSKSVLIFHFHFYCQYFNPICKF